MLGSYHGIQAQGRRPEVTFLGRFPGSLSGVSIGAARPDRIIVCAGFFESDAGNAVGAPTINGVASTIISQPVISDPMGMFFAFAPTGTTLSIPGLGSVCIAWMITGVTAGMFSSVGGGTGASTYTASLSAPPRAGIFVGVARSRSSSGGFTANAVAGLESLSLDYGENTGASHNLSFAGASGKLNLTGTSVNANINFSGFNSGYGAGAVFA